MQLPEQHTQVGQPADHATESPLAQAVNEAIVKELAKTYHRDDTPLPTVGDTPPVAQPGIPPMSQRATDASRVMIAAGLATVPPGLIAIGILVASEHADPTVIGMICAAPAALAVPILAVASVLRRAKAVVEAAPAQITQHYTGTVHQDTRTVTSTTRGVIANTHNQPPQ